MSDPLPPPVPVQPIVLSYGNPDLTPERPLIPLPEKFFHFFAAILLPLACFGITAVDKYPLAPKWQRDEWFDYLSLIPNFPVGWAFYPLLIFSIYAAGWMIFGTRKAVASAICRVGVFAGIVLAWQYAFIQVVSLQIADDTPALGALLGLVCPPALVGVTLFARWAADQLVWRRTWYHSPRGKHIFWAIVVAIVMGVSAFFSKAVLGIAIFFSLLLAPGLTMFSFVAMAIVILRRSERPESQTPLLAGAVAWLAAWGAAWVQSYQNAIDAYSKLPTTHSGCYIATATLRGHRRFIGRRIVAGRPLSPQLAILKSGELALRDRWPGLHRAMRAVYDTVGPRIARRIRHPLVADVVYLTLKPIEWCAVLCKAAAGGR